ncbi:GntR family transcriptional regulator [Bacillus sp. Marseille-P3661]|uniref:GntR family transcriptional regulator n=1 Tax=Bacillus sp. Marseille-P3661 TaxID=1936234 RepID=UPI0015E181A4|nr:GntR family transcriptional regulator [Bacillus sp. Marseille-P3661]
MIKKQPLYETIYNDIVQKINDGQYSFGDMLPSEMELEQSYKISRTPVRQALKQLENDGYIYRLQGKGSFVANNSPSGKWILTTGFMQQYNQEWENISAKTIDISEVDDPHYSSILRANKNQKIYRIKRIRYINNGPVLFLNHYINPNIPIKLFSENPEFNSKDQILKEKANIEILEIQERLEAIIATDEVAEMLNLEEGSPVLKITRISSSLQYNPVDVTVYYANTDKWNYTTNYKNE